MCTYPHVMCALEKIIDPDLLDFDDVAETKLDPGL